MINIRHEIVFVDVVVFIEKKICLIKNPVYIKTNIMFISDVVTE